MIDAHVHAFPTAEWGRGWQTEARFEPVRDGTLDDVTARMDAAGIEAAILLLFARPGGRSRDQAAGEIRGLNRWGLDVARQDPRFMPFVGVDPNVLTEDELASEIRDAAAGVVRGEAQIRQAHPPQRLEDHVLGVAGVAGAEAHVEAEGAQADERLLRARDGLDAVLGQQRVEGRLERAGRRRGP